MEGFDKLCSADPDTLMTVPPTSTFSFDGFMTLLCDINMTVLMEESNSYSGQKTIMDAVSIVHMGQSSLYSMPQSNWFKFIL